MDTSIRVRILDREYPLRVQEGDEALTHDIAAYVNAKMEAFRKAHPEQTELTAAVITALGIAEELHSAWEQEDRAVAALDADLKALSETLEAALSDASSPSSESSSSGSAAP